MRKLKTKIAVVVAGAMLASMGAAGTAFAAGEVGPSMPDYVPSCGQPAKKPFIGKKIAKQIAFDEAGVKKSRCSKVSVDLRKRSKKKVYVVNFTHKSIMKYHYTIAARSGKVLSYYAKHV